LFFELLKKSGRMKINFRTMFFLWLGLTYISSTVQAQEKGIRFSDAGWPALLAEAKQSGKLIFMDAYATWCGPCKWMKANVFSDEKVGALYNRNFINAYIDMERGEGIALRKQYNIEAYPTALYINGDGEVVHKTVGQSSATDFIQQGLDAMSPQRNLLYLEKHHAEKSKDAGFVTTYLKALKKAYELDACNSIALEYLQSKDSASWQQSSNWLILQEYVTDATSPVFNYLVRHQQQFAGLYGSESVEAKIYNTYQGWPQRYLHYLQDGKVVLDEQAFAIFLSQVAGSPYLKREEIKARAKLTVYFGLHEWPLYASTVGGMLEKNTIPMNPAGAEWLYAYANTIKRFAKDNKPALSAAVGWAKIITEDIQDILPQNRAMYLDLYASLLEAAGNTRLAQETRKKINGQMLTEAKQSAPFQQLQVAPKKN